MTNPTPTFDPSRRALLRGGCAGALRGAAAAMGTGTLAGLAAAGGIDASPRIGDLVRWPAVTLLDGSRLGPAASVATAAVFFTTTCPFCARHNVHMQRLHEASRGQPIRVLGIAIETDAERVRTYMARRGLGFPVTLDHAPLQAVLSRQRGVPLSCVVDRGQRLREVIRGEMFEEDVLEFLRWARA